TICNRKESGLNERHCVTQASRRWHRPRPRSSQTRSPGGTPLLLTRRNRPRPKPPRLQSRTTMAPERADNLVDHQVTQKVAHESQLERPPSSQKLRQLSIQGWHNKRQAGRDRCLESATRRSLHREGFSPLDQQAPICPRWQLRAAERATRVRNGSHESHVGR